MKKLTIIFSLLIFIMIGTTTVFADSQEIIYTTGEELSQALIVETSDGGELTSQEQLNLLSNSSQAAQNELAEEAIKESYEALANEDLSLQGESFTEETFELDCGVKCNITLTDEEDISMIQSLIGEIFFDEASANTAPEVLWKDYGARRFTAVIDIAFFGGIVMKEVVHYTIGDSGLTVTDDEALNDPPWGLYRIHKKTSECEDRYAQLEGYDIHASGKFWIYKDIEGIWTPYKIKLVRAKVKLMVLDKQNNRAQLYQTCEYENL